MSEGKLVQPSVSDEKLVQPSVSDEKLVQPSVSEDIDNLVQPSVSEGKLVQPSVNEEKLVFAGVSEEKLIQPSVIEGKLVQPRVSEGKLSISRTSGLRSSTHNIIYIYIIYSEHSFLPVCACVYSFQSRPSSICVLSVLPLTWVGLCLTVYYCGFLWEFMGYQAYANLHNKSIPYLKYTVVSLRENSG